MEQIESLEFRFQDGVFKQPRWKIEKLDRTWTVFYIDNPFCLDKVWSHLGKPPKFLAIDSERDVIFDHEAYTAPVARVRVITLCSRNTCFVISATHLGMPENQSKSGVSPKDDQNRYILHPKLTKLFEGETTIKIGFGLEQDWQYIVGSFCAENRKDGSFKTLQPKGSVDLRAVSLAFGDKRGLQEQTSARFGFELDKSLQRSKHWKKVPLPEEFIEYAALDGIATMLLAEEILHL